MAAAGIPLPGLSYAELCGLYYRRHAIAAERRNELAKAIADALAGTGLGG